jgi:hypothetical protein
MMIGVSYAILQNYILKSIDGLGGLKLAIRKQYIKVIASFVINMAAIPFAFVSAYIYGMVFLR